MNDQPLSNVTILGGGSAGLLAALTFKRMTPELDVEVIHSEKLGVIGVGEGTTVVFPEHLFKNLGIPPKRFYQEAEPTWKLGIKFVWGSRGEYFYDFSFQYDAQFPGMAKPTGFYADEDCRFLNDACALMQHDNAFISGPAGKPVINHEHAFHIENHKLVKCLRSIAAENGVKFSDDTLVETKFSENGIEELVFESGRRVSSDLFVDASGFGSELVGKALAEPFKSFASGLFCDRAVIAGWQRGEEPIAPYTTAETMNSGWSWQIEHEHFINRGYVYSSDFISDQDALDEFLTRNPKIETNPRVVKFKSGRYHRNWVKNAVAIGNASGFVEPLEATALAQAIYEAHWLVALLKKHRLTPTQAVKDEYNHEMGKAWDEIRDFLAFHYKFNTLKDTPFWKACHADTSLGDYDGFYQAYQKLGPSEKLIKALPSVPNIYGIEGYLAMLVGMRVPHNNPHKPLPNEQKAWEKRRNFYRLRGRHGISVKQALQAIRSPNWDWSKVKAYRPKSA